MRKGLYSCIQSMKIQLCGLYDDLAREVEPDGKEAQAFIETLVTVTILRTSGNLLDSWLICYDW